jgi:hypothetical protein
LIQDKGRGLNALLFYLLTSSQGKRKREVIRESKREVAPLFHLLFFTICTRRRIWIVFPEYPAPQEPAKEKY